MANTFIENIKQNKTKKLATALTIVCLIATLISVFVLDHYKIGNEYSDYIENLSEGWRSDGKPFNDFGKQLDTNEITISHVMRLNSFYPKAVGFSNYYCAVEVYLDDTKIYEYGSKQDLDNNVLLGNLYSIVEMPNQVDEARIVSIHYLSDGPLTIYPIDFGTPVGLSNEQYIEYLPVIVLSVTSLIALATILVFKLRARTSSLISYRHLWLAMFIITSVVWVIADSQLLMYLGFKAGRVCQLSFNLYMLFPICLEMFEHYSCDCLKRKGIYWCWLSICHYLIVVILDLMGIASFIDTLWTSHIFVGITITIILYQVIKEHRDKNTQVTLYNLLGTLLFILLSLIQYTNFYVDPTKSNTNLMSIGLILFFVSQISSIIYETGSKLKKNDENYRQIIEKTNLKLQERSDLLYKTFGKFVPNRNIEELLDESNVSTFKGERIEVTILQSDIRGFSSIIQGMEAKGAVDMLNNYLLKMTEIISRYNGTVIEFIGDAVLAAFGSPIKNEDHASSAIASALEMQLAMREVNRYNKNHAYPELQMGVGIDTGMVYVGYLGSEKRMKFDVIGPAVNLCSRIESYSIGGQILVSDNTLRLAKNVDTLTREVVYPKGFNEKVYINSVIGIGKPYNVSYLPSYNIPKTIEEKIKISFNIISEKHIEKKANAGLVVAVSSDAVIIESNKRCELFTDIRIAKYNLIGKVISSSAKGMLVRFTQIPNDYDGWGHIKETDNG